MSLDADDVKKERRRKLRGAWRTYKWFDRIRSWQDWYTWISSFFQTNAGVATALATTAAVTTTAVLVHNTVVNPYDEPYVPVEVAPLVEPVRQTQGTMIFEIEGRPLTTVITSIRSVAWDNLQPNFYLIFSPEVLTDFPSTFMTSFYLQSDQKQLLSDLLRKFPTMTVLEVDALIEQIQTIVGQVTLAVEFMLVLILLSGAMVLLASIQASLDERMQQFAILRTLGASNRLVRLSLALEFAVLGGFAGLLATLGAEATVYGLEREIFDLTYTPTPLLWLVGPVIGAVLISAVGMLATRKVLDQPPVAVLRSLG